MQTGEDYFKDTTDDFSSGGGSSRSIKPSKTDRTDAIEKIFMDALGRKPSSREMAYYKYSPIKEDDIVAKLISSDEHKKIIESALKLPGVQEELKNVRMSEKKLQQQLDDINEEIGEYKKLLSEKDKLINELREKVNNPYDFPTQIQKYEEGFDVYTPKERKVSESSKSKTFKEKLIDLIDTLF